MVDESNKCDEKFKNSMKWRKEYAKFLRVEVEKNAEIISKLALAGKSTLYEVLNEDSKKVSDLGVLFRIMTPFLDEKEHKLLPIFLHKWIIFWVLARFEYITEGHKFHKGFAEDYEINFSGKTIDKVFRDNWEKYGKNFQDCFEKELSSLLLPSSDSDSETASTSTIKKSPDLLPTLDRFPDAFNPMAVIVGGYTGDIQREPEHIYELFRQSQSFINLHYLLKLKLDEATEIVSDQLFIELKDSERAKEILGTKNLLVVGGPLVNAVSRHLILTKQLVFNFAYNEATYLWQKKGVYDFFVNSGLFNDSSSVKMFSQMLRMPQHEININNSEFVGKGVDEENRKKLKKMLSDIRKNLMGGNMKADNQTITDRFIPREMFSPLESELISCVTNSDHENAIVSVGNNPWADLLRKKNSKHQKYFVIVVAGVNEIGTTRALKTLSQKGIKENFINRPLGGLLDISKRSEKGLARVTRSKYHWKTQEYQIDDLINNVNDAKKSFAKRPESFQYLFKEPQELEKYQEMLQQFVANIANTSDLKKS